MRPGRLTRRSIGYTTYCPSKYALRGLLESLRYEYLTKRIRLHYYAPSNMDTPGFAVENEGKPDIVRQVEDNAATLTADVAAQRCLRQLDRFMITSDPDLEVLRVGNVFMAPTGAREVLMALFSAVVITGLRLSIERKIRALSD